MKKAPIIYNKNIPDWRKRLRPEEGGLGQQQQPIQQPIQQPQMPGTSKPIIGIKNYPNYPQQNTTPTPTPTPPTWKKWMIALSILLFIGIIVTVVLFFTLYKEDYMIYIASSLLGLLFIFSLIIYFKK